MNDNSNVKTPILIVARDMYPPFRVDVTILFSKYLKKYLKIDWLMRHEASKPGTKVSDGDETYYIIGRNGIRGKLDAVGQHLKAVYRIFRKDYAIVQCRDTFLAASLYSIASRLSGVPFVYWMSYPMEEGYLLRARTAFAEKRYAGALVRWIIGTLGRLSLYYIALPIAHHIFVQSDQMKSDLLAEGVRGDKITPVPMGVDTELFTLEKIEASADPRYTGKRVIFYSGTIDPIRSMEVPLAAVVRYMSLHEDVIMCIAGKSSDEEKRKVRIQFESKDLGQDILFLEHMPLRALLAQVKRADICLASYPTNLKALRSATPTKLLEYLAMGRRVVANHHPDQTLVVDGTKLGVLAPFSEDGFYQALEIALQMGAPSEKEVARAQTWIVNNRSYSALSERVWNELKNTRAD